MIIYKGPSRIDGAPIVVIATGLAKASANAKTGALVQTWILREDVSPLDAVNSGADVSICGDCPHRGAIVDGRNVDRSCYVTVFQAPQNVWKTYKRGGYPELSRGKILAAFSGKKVRLGAYGDPAAVPFKVWQTLLRWAGPSTGYTHRWRECAPSLKHYCMASCDNARDHEEAKAMGWRTFRVRSAHEALAPREIACPASKEAGQKTTCSACLACGGTNAKARVDIAIVAHGSAGKVNAFERRA